MNQIMNIVLSITTTITAIIAIIISVIGINKSNKQSLFERRLKVYLTVKWMESLCNNDKENIANQYILNKNNIKKDDLFKLFELMTNCTFLKDIQDTLNYISEKDVRRKFFFKIESLKNLCEEVTFILPENICSTISDFIFYYEEALVAMYEYYVAMSGTNNSKENECLKKMKHYVKGTFELASRIQKDGTLRNVKNNIKL